MSRQLGLARRQSTRRLYQAKWAVYRRWCMAQGHSISRPSLPKVADFLVFLHRSKGLSPSAIKGYRSMLSLVFRSSLPAISTSSVIRDLIRSFCIARPRTSLAPPSWDVEAVLRSLRESPYEPLETCEFRALSIKTLFLVALATAKRVGELQALSFRVARAGQDLILSYLPEFDAKTESSDNPIPRSFPLKSLGDFVGDLEDEMLLCPVRALNTYLRRTSDIPGRPRALFVSPRNARRPLSKNALSFLIRSLIRSAGALGADEGPAPRAHSVRAVATSIAFAKNVPVSRVLEAGTWRSNTVFASFYLRDMANSIGGISSLGPIVSGGGVVR